MCKDYTELNRNMDNAGFALSCSNEIEFKPKQHSLNA